MKRVTSGGVHLCGIAPWQRRNVAAVGTVGDSVSDLTGPGNELQTYRTDIALFLATILTCY